MPSGKSLASLCQACGHKGQPKLAAIRGHREMQAWCTWASMPKETQQSSGAYHRCKAAHAPGIFRSLAVHDESKPCLALTASRRLWAEGTWRTGSPSPGQILGNGRRIWRAEVGSGQRKLSAIAGVRGNTPFAQQDKPDNSNLTPEVQRFAN